MCKWTINCKNEYLLALSSIAQYSKYSMHLQWDDDSPICLFHPGMTLVFLHGNSNKRKTHRKHFSQIPRYRKKAAAYVSFQITFLNYLGEVTLSSLSEPMVSSESSPLTSLYEDGCGQILTCCFTFGSVLGLSRISNKPNTH